ncbi:oxidoreductase (plasmid) [Shinella sp. PSBB067]|uniref:NAD(P)/FAD-dependent oxidoreductase n=1 Tax=Shinella sp. PSBB067 TaxID=2715959 RepID=UPI00193B3314|nr:FAD-dependent oxidoreductase [Shinella sp. PSBB067]QRI61691.1 oxidoreductase [Shinella sp. PSBB067]
MNGIVIIGAGEAGTRAAFALREAGFSGPVTLAGTEPHLPYERPPLSKPLDGVVQMKPICSAEALEAAGIDYLPGMPVTQIDAARRHLLLGDGRTLAYDRLLLATGARPRRLACPGAGRALDFRTFADAAAIFSRIDKGQSCGEETVSPSPSRPRGEGAGRRMRGMPEAGKANGFMRGTPSSDPSGHLLPEGRREEWKRSVPEVVALRAEAAASVAIVGGGLIGMELAAVLRGKGIAVSVVEAAARPLGRAVPARFAARLHARHAEEGVRFHLGQGIAEITPDAVVLADGTRVPADIVVSAIGVVPDTGLADAAGLATGNGILTDAFLRTSDPHVFAAGDCAAVSVAGGGHVRFESWRNARSQAETAARNMAGASEAFAAIPWFWSDQYDLGLQVAGLPQPGHDCILRPAGEGELEFYLDGGRLVAAAGLGPGNSLAKDIKLAEMLIAAGISPDPAALADPAVNLKALLKSARAA